MYVRWTSYEANALSDRVMPYRCAHCGHEAAARVYAAAAGTGISLYGVDEQGAAARAGRHARTSSEALAELAVRIAPCPRCHRRDRRTIRRIHRNTFLICLAMIAALTLVFAYREARLTLPVLIADAVVALLLAAIPALFVWKFRTSRLTAGRVQFNDASAAAAPPSDHPPVRDHR